MKFLNDKFRSSALEYCIEKSDLIFVLTKNNFRQVLVDSKLNKCQLGDVPIRTLTRTSGCVRGRCDATQTKPRETN